LWFDSLFIILLYISRILMTVTAVPLQYLNTFTHTKSYQTRRHKHLHTQTITISTLILQLISVSNTKPNMPASQHNYSN
jgi:hypothetical protein